MNRLWCHWAWQAGHSGVIGLEGSNLEQYLRTLHSLQEHTRTCIPGQECDDKRGQRENVLAVAHTELKIELKIDTRKLTATDEGNILVTDWAQSP